MNFCFLNPLQGFGGLEIQTILRAKDAQSLGHNSFVVVTRNTRSERYAFELGLETELLTRSPILKYIDVIGAIRLAKMFEQRLPHICIVPKSELLSLAILGRKLSKIKPAIVFYQQMQSGIRKKDPYHNWIYRHLDGAIVLTNTMKRMLLQTTTFPENQTFVVPYGVKLESYEPFHNQRNTLRQKFNLPKDKFIIGCVGRIEPHKGQETLLHAFIEAKIPNSFLLFAGSVDNKAYFADLQKIAEEGKVSNNVRYLEFTKDIPELMNTFDVFVMPSNSETFGLVAIEAMASALPVIATNAGGVPEIIDNGVDGLLFKPKDSATLTELLWKVYNAPLFAKSLGSNAFEKVKIKFDYKKNVNTFFEVCQLIYEQKTK
jgi:glycosyltransferase involved in cell wall biosynthesis